MSLSQQIEQELTSAGSGPVSLSAQQGDNILVCELVAIDTLGVSATRLELKSKRLAGLATSELKNIADTLAKRVSYLLEAIAPVEVDDQACTIQMRSNPPYRKENATSYYEVLVTAGSISLKRYNKTAKSSRHAEPFDITRQVLGRLIDDFAHAAEG